MDSILEKLNQNRLMELEDVDFEQIANNTELKSLFLAKIKEGYPFNVEYAYQLQDDLLTPEYIPFLLDIIVKQDFDSFMSEYVFESEENIAKQLPPQVLPVFFDYINNYIPMVLDYLKTNDEVYGSIENPKVIKIIIDNKLEQHYGSICMKPVSFEFEQLLIDAMGRYKYKNIYTISSAIIDRCVETDQLSSISLYNIDSSDPEINEIILRELDQGNITVENLSHNFINDNINDLRVYRNALRYSSYKKPYLKDIDQIEKRHVLIEEIERNHELVNEFYTSDFPSNYPDVVISIIKYYKTSDLIHLICYYSNSLYLSFETKKDDFIDALIYNLDHNLDHVEVLFSSLNNGYDKDFCNKILFDPKFFNFLVTKVDLNLVLKTFIKRDDVGNYFIEDNVMNLLKDVDVHFSKVPDNFIYKINYPNNVWRSLIPMLSKEQLVPNNIYLPRFNDNPEIFDCILMRLKELKSNVYNSSLEFWQGQKTELLVNIVCDKDNPLNLTLTQKLNIIPTAKLTGSNYILEMINQIDVIDTSAYNRFISVINTMDDLDKVRKVWKAIFAKIEFNSATMKSLSSRSADIYGTISQTKEGEKPNIDEKSLIFYECLGECLLNKKGIPLSLTRYFNNDVIKNATFSCTEYLVSNPEFFSTNRSYLPYLVEFIKDCKNKHLPIDFMILYSNNQNNDLLDYDNITFSNNQETYQALYNLLCNSKPNMVYKNIIDYWINNFIDYNFFDINDKTNRNDLLNELLSRAEYTERILNIITTKKTSNGVILTNSLLNMLIIKQNSPEITQKVFDIIINLIENNLIDKFVPDSNLEYYLSNIKHPIFIKYVIDTCISNIFGNVAYIEIFLKYPEYRQVTLDTLYKNLQLATNNNILKLAKEDKDIKEYIKYYLENVDNSSLVFNQEFLDIELLQSYLKGHSIDSIITYIVHNPVLELINDDAYSIIKTELLNKHPEYNKDVYDLLEKNYGLEILTLLETENLKNILQKDINYVTKLIEVFKDRKLDESIITSVNDSLRQNYFSIENEDIINFYTNTLVMIQRGITEDEIKEIINTIVKYIPNDLEKDIMLTGNELLLNTYKRDYSEFMRMLIQELGNNQNIYAPLFNKITNYFIIQKRNEYRSTQDIYKDTNLKYNLETKSLYNAIFNYMVKNNLNVLIKILESMNEFSELNLKTLYFLNGDVSKYSPEELPEIKKNIRVVKNVIFDYIRNLNEKENRAKIVNIKRFENLPKLFEKFLENEELLKSVKKIPIYPPKRKLSDTISNINLESFEKIINDEEKYNALIALLNKYRFLEWNDLFNGLVQKLSLGEDSINIYNFINAFNQIYENEKKIILRERKKLIDIVVEEMRQQGKSQEEIDDYLRVKNNEPINVQISAYKVLKCCAIYSSISNYYKIILGVEDFELVKKNDGPNAAHCSREDRLQKTCEMQIKMMQFNEVTIPSFIHDYQTDEEQPKKLRVIVGNRSSSRNLTHGERTGACMRAYGHADALFEFCNLDPRGFHIVFVDPETNEYVSRVSGFRNGNTVFLNQLRHSVSSKYSNDDVINACTEVALELIERSKDSSMPIENVVASPYYALDGYETQLLSESDIGRDVYTGYKDVSYNAVVLATTGENNLAKAIKLDSNQPIYEAVRLEPLEYNKENINTSVLVSLQRITAIKECLENIDMVNYYKTIDFDYEIFDTEYVHVIIGQDWYVALDVNGNITHDIAVQNEHSIEELNAALSKINELKNEQIKSGGFVNGK